MSNARPTLKNKKKEEETMMRDLNLLILEKNTFVETAKRSLDPHSRPLPLSSLPLYCQYLLDHSLDLDCFF